MSKWPDRRVSLPQDQPTRYLDSGLSSFSFCSLIALVYEQEKEGKKERQKEKEKGSYLIPPQAETPNRTSWTELALAAP